MSSPPPSILEIHSGIRLKGRLSMVRDVILTGKFEGELQTLGCLTVASGGEVSGSIEAGALVLEPGHAVSARVKIAPQPRTGAKIPAETGEAAEGFWTGRFQKLKKLALGRK